MQLDKKKLKEIGAFVPDVPVKREIKFKLAGQEYDATIHVRQLSAGDYETIFLAGESGRSQTAEVISKCVTLGDSGKEKISFEEAYKLHPSVAAAMIDSFNEVNAQKKA